MSPGPGTAVTCRAGRELIPSLPCSALCLVPEHGVVPVSSECQHLFPTKIVSRLVKWTAIPFEDYTVGAECEAVSPPAPLLCLRASSCSLPVISPCRNCPTLKTWWRLGWLKTPISITWH